MRKTTNSNSSIEKFKFLRNKLVELIRVSKRLHFREYFHKNLKNPKEIWKGIRDLVSLKEKNPSKSIILNNGEKNETDPRLLMRSTTTSSTSLRTYKKKLHLLENISLII